MSEFIRISGTNGVVLEEYNGKYSITSAWEAKDGRTMLNWAKIQIKKETYAEKATPIKIMLGDIETARAALEMMLAELGPAGTRNEPPPIDENDVPF